uniref:hypothetical protein n=1 Tax=uncultured Dysgonomonas sp. TaxID=206096 RepID=UPI00262251C0|nr:hypothetical protein [uncultured Dysgonomonas sp.]
MEQKFKKGDKVVIIPCDSHEYYVKPNYNKVLEIEKFIDADIHLYKIKGIDNHAREQDLEHAAIHFMSPDILFDIIDKSVSAIDGVDLSGKDIDWIRDYIIDTAFSE